MRSSTSRNGSAARAQAARTTSRAASVPNDSSAARCEVPPAAGTLRATPYCSTGPARYALSLARAAASPTSPSAAACEPNSSGTGSGSLAISSRAKAALSRRPRPEPACASGRGRARRPGSRRRGAPAAASSGSTTSASWTGSARSPASSRVDCRSRSARTLLGVVAAAPADRPGADRAGQRAQHRPGVAAPHDQPAAARAQRGVERAQRGAVVGRAPRRAPQAGRRARVDHVDRHDARRGAPAAASPA